jgi:ABC-type transport system involved in Fe-S cluster assembly fused permease/ATPase subunit
MNDVIRAMLKVYGEDNVAEELWERKKTAIIKDVIKKFPDIMRAPDIAEYAVKRFITHTI